MTSKDTTSAQAKVPESLFGASTAGPPVFDDNPSLVEEALAKVRETFSKGKTKSYSYRML